MRLVRHCLNRYGLWPMIGLATFISVSTSLLITVVVNHAYLDTPTPTIALAIATLCPLIIAPIVSGFAFSLLLQLLRAHERLVRITEIDHLTGLYNRCYFMAKLREEIEHANQGNIRFSIAFVDIDDFKSINDTYGHLIGDEVLRRLAGECTNCIRQSDTFARIGGEEFAMLLPRTGIQDACFVVERLRERVAAIRIPIPQGELSVTVSIGVTSPAPTIQDLDAPLRRADEALYAAKRQGKNRVVSEPAALRTV